MNSKALAVMLAAVMAFVCFAVVAEQTDADGETLTIDIEKKILETPETAGNFDIVVTTNAAVQVTPAATTGISAPAAKTTEGGDTTFTASFNFTYDAKTASGSSTITFTADGYPTATCQVYWGVYEIVPSLNYVQVADTSSTPATPAITLTIKGTPLTGEKILVRSTNTTIIAETDEKVAELNITEGSATLTATDIAAGSFGSTKLNFTLGAASATTFVYAGEAVMEYIQDSTNGLKAIVYSSGKVYMDTTEMNLMGTPDVLFDVSYDADGDNAADKTQSFGPVSAQKRILIEIPGYVDFENVGKTTIVMKSKATALAIATLNGGATPAAFDATALTFKLDKNSGDRPAYSDDDFETSFVETYPAAPATYVVKNADVTASIYVQGYSFLGWGAESDSTTYFDLELTDGKIKVEEYLFAVSGDLEIFAIWNDIYNITVEYKYTAAPVEENNGKVFIWDGTDLGDAVATATTSSVAKSGDNLLLRIQQTTPSNYIYTVNAYAAHGWSGSAETTTPATTGTEVVMLTNGIWVIQKVQEDLHIVVTAKESEAPVTGYHFAVDSITNSTNNATAIISWDAIDLVPTGTLSAAGTYFKIDEALGNVYGSLEGNYGQIYTAALKVDNQDNTTAISSGVVTLSEETGYNYDLTITTTGTSSDKIFLYAVQGIWSEGNTKTVWSLVA